MTHAKIWHWNTCKVHVFILATSCVLPLPNFEWLELSVIKLVEFSIEVMPSACLVVMSLHLAWMHLVEQFLQEFGVTSRFI